MDESGFILVDNYSGEALYNQQPSLNGKYCYPEEIIIFICLKGSAKFNIAFTDYEITENSFFAIAPGIPFYFLDHTEDFRIDIFAITEPAFNKATQGLMKMHLDKILYEYPYQHVPPEKIAMSHNIHSYLKDLIKHKDNHFRRQIIRSYLNILIYEACNIMLHNPDSIGYSGNKRDNKIAGGFIVRVGKGIRTSRKVEYYAQQMNLTPKYLSAKVKESTGMTALEWIDDYTLTEAKTLLRSTSNTIQDISYDLCFATPSHFAKFFKDKTGISPKEFRKG